MRLSLNWLRDYVALPEDLDPKRLAHELTMTTVEVEQAEELGHSLDKVVLASIVAVTPHPDAARLNVVRVSLGDREQSVVCGGANVAVGMKVALALSGAVVRGRDGAPFELSPTTIRGVPSNGMLCAGVELGLQDLLPCGDHDIADLSDWDGELGAPLAEVLGWDDVILEIDNKSLTNRPDLWGHYGIARELAAIYDLPLKPLPAWTPPRSQQGVRIDLDDPERCPRYTGTRVRGVDARQAPNWMRSRLARVGQRPINLLVDLTNYVMMASGQPSHAFDARDVPSAIGVRRAREGEALRLLDGTDLSLSADDLVIATPEEGAVALAGVMGGDQAIRPDTTELFLEMASFVPVPIRRTARTYGLRTESSTRFEKGLDCARVDQGLGLFFALLERCCPGAEAFAHADAFPAPPEPLQVDVRVDFLQRRLGKDLPEAELRALLARLGFATEADQGRLAVQVPSWRATGDVSLPEDIVEEVARLYGYEALAFVPPVVALEAPVIQPRRRLERRLKEHLAAHGGMREVVSYPWVSEKALEAAGMAELPCLALATPPSPETRRLKPALLPQLLGFVASNLRWTDSFRIFELGRVFQDGGWQRTHDSPESLPAQPRHLAAALVGEDAGRLFLEAKGLLEGLSRAVQCAPIGLVAGGELPWADPAAVLGVEVGGRRIGALGVLSARSRRLAGIRRSHVALFELEVDALEPYVSRSNRYERLPEYPQVDFDISMLLSLEGSWARVRELATQADPLVLAVGFVDEYTGAQVPEGQKSLTLRLRLGSPEGTLVREQIDEAAGRVMSALEAQLGAVIRRD